MQSCSDTFFNSSRQDPTTVDYLCSSHYTHKSAGRV